MPIMLTFILAILNFSLTVLAEDTDKENEQIVSYIENNADKSIAIGKSVETGELDFLEYVKPSVIPYSAGSSYETEAFIPQNLPIDYGEQSASSRTIIGNDDRHWIFNTSTFPNSAICFLQIYWKDGDYTEGTGYVVNKNQVITAGHNVFSAKRGGFADAIVVHPGINGNKHPFESTYAKYMMCGGFSDTVQADWAVLTLPSNTGLITGHFGVRYTKTRLINTSVTIRGYPGEYKREMLSASGPITYDTGTELSFKIDITKGQSGSPIYTSNYQSVGTAVRQYNTYNGGNKISEELFVYIGGKLPGGGEFTDGEDSGFTDGGDSGFTDGGDSGFTDGN